MHSDLKYTNLELLCESLIIGFNRTLKGMCDFEQPLRISMLRNWLMMMIKGCHFHYTQCLNSNFFHEKLRSIYQQKGKNFNFEFYCNVRKFFALPLLPPNLVGYAWNSLVKSCKKIHQLNIRKNV